MFAFSVVLQFPHDTSITQNLNETEVKKCNVQLRRGKHGDVEEKYRVLRGGVKSRRKVVKMLFPGNVNTQEEKGEGLSLVVCVCECVCV